MSLLFRILYAAHASGTHHKLALDALDKLEGVQAEGWRRIFLAHAEALLRGAKAPDKEFKDFKNHVLHVRDGYWGGAADQTESWYGRLVADLAAARWREAAYSAGVLSHYYADPIHPFHTGQTEAENNIHRAVEWSISRSYDLLRKLGEADFAHVRPMPGSGASWLRDFVAAGADTSNRYYEKLMAHYDIDRGVADPSAGLDAIGRRIVAELITYASSGFARVIERAVADASVAPPAVDLTLETVLAGLRIPLKLVTKRLEDAADRREVERMYDELKATGRVEHTLGEAERTVRELHAVEVVAAQAQTRARSRAAIVVGKTEANPAAEALSRVAAAAAAAFSAPAPPAHALAVVPVIEAGSTGGNPLAVDAPGEARPQRSYLDPTDDVERAPSIGPKTAERLYRLGIRTVVDLMSADPARVAAGLDVRHVDAGTILDWQDQSRLVIDVPGLRGTHAQLLVGAGCRTLDALAGADPDTLCARVLAFAGTAVGKRLLRESGAPDIERIRGWLDSARAAAAARGVPPFHPAQSRPLGRRRGQARQWSGKFSASEACVRVGKSGCWGGSLVAGRQRSLRRTAKDLSCGRPIQVELSSTYPPEVTVAFRSRQEPAPLSSSSAAPAAKLPLRTCVGIMLLSADGHVWVGRRRHAWLGEAADPVWQMPQGGIEDGEAPERAAFRELHEETGVTSAEIIGQVPRWLSYELPPGLVGTALKGRYRGQRQRWFAMRFTGRDSEIDIRPRKGGKAEFEAWRWVEMAEVPRLIVPFKRSIYEAVVAEFAHLAR